ncbi:MAG: hypothetical protein DIU73_001830 [Actinomycetes bacterium]|nr:MAG: hypothetical protein DIU73_00820 [Actinomycetota bacterium]
MEDSDGVGGAIAFLFASGPAAGIMIWGWIHSRYRNPGARYRPESTVHHKVTRLEENDTFLRQIVSKRSRTEGANDHDPSVRAIRWKAVKH